MSVCTHKPNLMIETTVRPLQLLPYAVAEHSSQHLCLTNGQSMNMRTGEDLIRDQQFWADVVAKFELTDQQVGKKQLAG